MGKMMLLMSSMFAEMENNMRRERALASIADRREVKTYRKKPAQYRRMGKRWLKQRGEWMLVDDPGERHTMREIYDQHEMHDKTFVEIKQYLDKSDIRNFEGKRWSASAIHRGFLLEKEYRDARSGTVTEDTARLEVRVRHRADESDQPSSPPCG